MIIGFTGKNAAGKTVACKYLESKGFISYSLSDAIRDEATKRNLEHSRENLTNLGNQLRKEFGPGVLAIKTNEKIKNQSEKNTDLNFAIDSIRSPFEVEELKKANFVLIGIEADSKLRFERLLKRNRSGDVKTFEEFQKQEEKENTNDKNSQQLDGTLKLSDKIIYNNNSLEEFYKKIDEICTN